MKTWVVIVNQQIDVFVIAYYFRTLIRLIKQPSLFKPSISVLSLELTIVLSLFEVCYSFGHEAALAITCLAVRVICTCSFGKEFFIRPRQVNTVGEAPWSGGEHQGLSVWAMVPRRGFNSCVHLKTRWIRWTTWWQKKNENNKDSQKGQVTPKNI